MLVPQAYREDDEDLVTHVQGQQTASKGLAPIAWVTEQYNLMNPQDQITEQTARDTIKRALRKLRTEQEVIDMGTDYFGEDIIKEAEDMVDNDDD